MILRAACVALALPGAALAFTPPPGCTPEVTIQSRSCLMTHVWTCEGDAPGDKWMALFNSSGPSRVRKVDDEFQWLETYYLDPVRTETMVVPAPDPEDLTELFANGVDTFDFTTVDEDGIARRIKGFDRLTGESLVIDGETLLRTEYAYDILSEGGALLDAREGRQYVSETRRIFLLGRSWPEGQPDQVYDASPVDILRPGDSGFFANTPIYDCGEVMSRYRPLGPDFNSNGAT